MNKGVKLYVVVPCYNEEEVLNETAKRLTAEFDRLEKTGLISKSSRIVLVDDGSRDKTWSLIEKLAKEEVFVGLKLSRNRGHQNALLAGLMYAKDHAEVVVSMDADLQDDIGAVERMVQKYVNDDVEIVYGVRSSRKKDTFFKRTTAIGFYKIMKLLGVDVIYNHADYRLMSRRALEELEKFDEVNLFLRGVVPLIGLKTSTVEYERSERFAGESKYPLKKMLSFAAEGITSFSVKPLKLITAMGVVFAAIGVAVTIYALVMWLTGQTVEGWTFIVISLWLIGGVQMVGLGVVGTYIGKIYGEVKGRPRYIVEKIVGGKAR